jgi:Type I restriction modification DNA specificity domain.
MVKIDTSDWKKFEIGKLFPRIVKPPVLHNRQVIEDANGIPYVVRTKFDNGIKCRVQRNDEMKPSPAGVISFGAENATFFYQPEEFVSGRDIYYIDTQELSDGACMFLTACLQPIARKYSYNYGLFPELLKSERIKLPVDFHGCPDWAYMDSFMAEVMKESEACLENLRLALRI